MEQWKKETGESYGEFEVQTDAQREQAIRRFAQKGADPIVTVGFAQGTALEKVAKEFPETHFVIIDFVVNLPNVESIVFKEHEGSFLVGALAAMASKTGKVGFVGGMDIPLIRRFQCGYEQGVKYEKKDATVFGNMTGTTPSAWNDPTKGGELAKSQFEQGADVVFAAAGATSLGVYQAAKDSGKLAIGVDSNQNYLHPGTMLTSMTKRVDVAVHGAVTGWKGGVSELGLKEAGVDWALDEHNKALVTDEMKAKIEAIKARHHRRQDPGPRLRGRQRLPGHLERRCFTARNDLPGRDSFQNPFVTTAAASSAPETAGSELALPLRCR